jgi:hypothetical protein
MHLICITIYNYAKVLFNLSLIMIKEIKSDRTYRKYSWTNRILSIIIQHVSKKSNLEFYVLLYCL